MLYEFHEVQNSKKPGLVRATYLLDGVPRATKEPDTNGHELDGEDVHMQSSPYMSSSMPQPESDDLGVPQRRITLVREEDLAGKMIMSSAVGPIYCKASGQP